MMRPRADYQETESMPKTGHGWGTTAIKPWIIGTQLIHERDLHLVAPSIPFKKTDLMHNGASFFIAEQSGTLDNYSENSKHQKSMQNTAHALSYLLVSTSVETRSSLPGIEFEEANLIIQDIGACLNHDVLPDMIAPPAAVLEGEAFTTIDILTPFARIRFYSRSACDSDKPNASDVFAASVQLFYGYDTFALDGVHALLLAANVQEVPLAWCLQQTKLSVAFDINLEFALATIDGLSLTLERAGINLTRDNIKPATDDLQLNLSIGNQTTERFLWCRNDTYQHRKKLFTDLALTFVMLGPQHARGLGIGYQFEPNNAASCKKMIFSCWYTLLGDRYKLHKRLVNALALLPRRDLSFLLPPHTPEPDEWILRLMGQLHTVRDCEGDISEKLLPSDPILTKHN
jgi:hypothetical protein